MDKNEFEFEELKDKGSTLSVHTGDPIAIREMQKSLNEWGYTDAWGRKLSEDGDFGKNTFNAVIKYQEDNGLFPDGVVGDKTWKSMVDKKKKEEEESYTNLSNTDSGAVPPQNDVEASDNVNNPREHGAFATIDKAFETSSARIKENAVTEDAFAENEEDFECLKEKGSVLSVHSGSPYTIKELQKELNSMGYTDALGRPLSEDGDFGINTFNAVIKFQEDNGLFPDGVVGDKTWKAISDKKREKDNETKEPSSENFSQSIYEDALYNSFPKEVKLPYPSENETSFTEEEQAEATKESGVIKPGYNAKGEWSEDPDADNYGKESVEYKMISKLNGMCEKASGQNKNNIAIFAEDFRDFDTDSICKAYYLNDSDGANKNGHIGLLLVDKEGNGMLFSYGAASTKDIIYGDARMYVGVYEKNGVEWLLNNQHSFVLNEDGDWLLEKYDRWHDFKVSSENGYKILENAIDASVNLEKYAVLWNNCNQMVIEALAAGGINIEHHLIPNDTFENIS